MQTAVHLITFSDARGGARQLARDGLFGVGQRVAAARCQRGPWATGVSRRAGTWLGGSGWLSGHECQVPHFGTLALESEWHLALWHSTLFGTWHSGTREASGTWHSGTRTQADRCLSSFFHNLCLLTPIAPRPILHWYYFLAFHLLPFLLPAPC